MKIGAYCESATVQEYVLSHAILMYSERSSSRTVFASVHDVETKKGTTSIQPGTPVSKSGLTKMLRTLAPENYAQPALFGNHILSQGNNHLVWFCKPQKRQVWFRTEQLGGDVSGLADLPGLVFVVTKDEWHVFAVKGVSRPRPSTPLYVAPFLNVWEGGNICTGNIKTPSGAERFSTEAWEEAFFRSYFTHPNQHGVGDLTKFKGGIFPLWRSLLKGKKFSTETLVPARVNLAQAFERTVCNGKS